MGFSSQCPKTPTPPLEGRKDRRCWPERESLAMGRDNQEPGIGGYVRRNVLLGGKDTGEQSKKGGQTGQKRKAE